jgi:two-component system, chemotaxis family, protein-glutamate methylesterase/glutaminase
MRACDGRPLHVLVVDDSAVVREATLRLSEIDSAFVVSVAADPLIAFRKMAQVRPDVILLDLAMPRMDGMSFLRRVMATDPVPIVVCSALTGGATAEALRALDEGAVDVVGKPRINVRGSFEESLQQIADTLRAAAQARVWRRRPARPASMSVAQVVPSAPRRTDAVVAIGASTGGTEALAAILRSLPEDAPGIVIVQHMPEGFTGPFARRLDSVCRIRIAEARDEDPIATGRALIAPGNRHMTLQRRGSGYCVRVCGGPLVARHRPSVDVLFLSVAEHAGAAAVGVLLTGMGSDGAEGLASMKHRGAATIAQDESTCVVFGMPKEAIARGAVGDVVPLARIADLIVQRAASAQAHDGRRADGA